MKIRNIIEITPRLVFLSLGYLMLLGGISIVVSEWSSDRMLHDKYDFFKILITQSENPQEILNVISFINTLADQSSIFNLMGFIGIISGIIGLITGFLMFRDDLKGLNKFYAGNLPALKISANSLIVIFSTLFAVSLIFISISEQISSDIEQNFYQTILKFIENSKLIDQSVKVFEVYFKKNTFEFSMNVIHSAYFAQLGLTFLIIYSIRRIKKLPVYVLHNDLIIMAVVSFIFWTGLFISFIGVSGPPQIPDIIVSNPIK